MKTIRFAVCGAGMRGSSLTQSDIIRLPDTVIPAVCDLYEDRATALADAILKKCGYRPNPYTNYREMLEQEKPDAVLIATAWEAHTEIAVEAMKRGIAVAMEVGGAYNEEECRVLVATWEKTKTPFMFLENCCFGKDELLATSMARKGLFGRVVYCHGSYAHDLRREIAYGDLDRHYRLRNYSTRNCDNYPTHDLGPIARLLGINRGNRMVSLVSRSSTAAGLHEYVTRKPELEYLRDREFPMGDIVETLITCENGELISLRLDTTLPRYYSREFTVRGTKGMYSQDNNIVVIDGDGFKENFTPSVTMRENNNNAERYSEYLPKIWRPENQPTGGHGGMDYLEFLAFEDALREGKPMPIDVYDAAAWMSVTYLSEQSIKQGGAPVEIPDFTNGAYKTRQLTDVTEL